MLLLYKGHINTHRRKKQIESVLWLEYTRHFIASPNGSVPKLAQIGLPFTLDLWIRTLLGLLSGPIWDRFPRCTHLDPCSFRSSVRPVYTSTDPNGSVPIWIRSSVTGTKCLLLNPIKMPLIDDSFCVIVLYSECFGYEIHVAFLLSHLG